jgi:16S rRNA (cytidine1402-2'-O)-methyltransferase
VLCALAASGFPADRFVFAGFLPRKGGSRAEALAWLSRAGTTAVLYEAGNRTAGTLRDLADALGDRPALVARELTKLHEELLRGPLTELAGELERRGEVRGEVTVVVGPPPAESLAMAGPKKEVEPLEEELRRRLGAGEPPSALAREVARARGLRRSDVYDAIQRLQGR